MSKAEEFIKNKSHIIENPTSVWISSCNARKAVKIAREEMIEKACGYIDGLIELLNDRGYRLKKERIIGGLKQAMEDE